MTQPADIMTFWFEEHGTADWFGGSPEFDDEIRTRFADTHALGAQGRLEVWRATPQGRLAEIIVLDQFSRQLYRGKARAFAQDALALSLAQNAVALGADQKLPEVQRQFFYLPYMHSESLDVHKEACRLYAALGDEGALDYEYKHVAILERFGRYPHRNQAMGRDSTPEELEFLKLPGSGF